MAKKILFVGAGAIGSYIGSFLSRAGHDVTLVDPWAENVETIRKKGISVTGPHDPFEAHPREPLHDQPEAAVGQLEHLVNVRGRADRIEILEHWLFHGSFALREHANHPAG